MMYARVNHARTEILEIGARPDWHIDGEPVSDEILAAGGVDGVERDGWVPVIRDVPEYDSLFNTMVWLEQAEWEIHQDRVVQTFSMTDRPLSTIKGDVGRLVDNAADLARSAFLTQGGPGQALEYNETRRELETWLTATDPDIDDYPMLRAECNARRVAEPNIAVQQVIDDTLAEISIWKQVNTAIKEIRRTAKVAIEVAETREHVKNILDWAGAAFHSASMTGQFEPLPSVT